MNVKDVVEKLIGRIDPIGETNVDADRLANLKEQCNLVDLLMADIICVANMSGEHKASVKESRDYAREYINWWIEAKDELME